MIGLQRGVDIYKLPKMKACSADRIQNALKWKTKPEGWKKKTEHLNVLKKEVFGLKNTWTGLKNYSATDQSKIVPFGSKCISLSDDPQTLNESHGTRPSKLTLWSGRFNPLIFVQQKIF
ncbi:hypothetical protein CHARACLAT_015017 [Characodon lateralis]|uniref:Uncharacterized protein n=1 Tax=Characodon lateralis TaxID=208331 RepID=A0ABU7E9T9_9TELE|nr:hypothetical protein [Characodon lateralis]